MFYLIFFLSAAFACDLQLNCNGGECPHSLYPYDTFIYTFQCKNLTCYGNVSAYTTNGDKFKFMTLDQENYNLWNAGKSYIYLSKLSAQSSSYSCYQTGNGEATTSNLYVVFHCQNMFNPCNIYYSLNFTLSKVPIRGNSQSFVPLIITLLVIAFLTGIVVVIAVVLIRYNCLRRMKYVHVDQSY